jgi:hypothetical protein
MRGLILAIVLALAAGCTSGPPDAYVAYRQVSVEEVPGGFDWELRPIEDASFRASIDPATAYERVYGAGKEPEAVAVLARVANTLEDSLGPPAWVFITPNTCFATAKGDLVSPGRTGNGCTPENLYVQGVDATTGETLGGFSAYEPPGGWLPDRAGTPPVVEATTQLGTTRLH